MLKNVNLLLIEMLLLQSQKFRNLAPYLEIPANNWRFSNLCPLFCDSLFWNSNFQPIEFFLENPFVRIWMRITKHHVSNSRIVNFGDCLMILMKIQKSSSSLSPLFFLSSHSVHWHLPLFLLLLLLLLVFCSFDSQKTAAQCEKESDESADGMKCVQIWSVAINYGIVKSQQ